MFRFIHTGDLHLGKRFGNFSGDLPGRLREARHAVIGALAAEAVKHDATAILLAGDTFDTETPAPDVRRQALAEMGQHPSIKWILLPGNHDSLQAVSLWEALEKEAPPNVILATDAIPIEVANNVFILPAPCTTRRPGRDLTAWMNTAETPEGAIRIGLAHGAIRDFSEDRVASEVIAPDRATQANLAFMALGDWHGTLQIDNRTWYSGTPEPDRFKHDRPGSALLVTISDATTLPEVLPLPVARFAWRSLGVHFVGDDDPATKLAALLPPLGERRHTLARVIASGRTRLAARTTLVHEVSAAMPDFAWLELEDGEVETECEVGDLDAIDRAGALRDAAETLLAEANNADLSAEERSIASAALARLYSNTAAVPQ